MDTSKPKQAHPEWATKHRKSGTELKRINGKYYLYGVASVYNKETKKTKKISLGILGSISEEKGFIPSVKAELKEKSAKSYYGQEIFSVEYGFSKWLYDVLAADGTLAKLKVSFPDLWQFIVCMVYTRVAYQSPLKNIPFFLQQADLPHLLGFDTVLNDQKVSNLLYELGARPKSIHEFMLPSDTQKRTVLMDATDIVLQSHHISLSQQGYNSHLDFQSQFVLLYLYDALSLEPLYYRILAGNLREIAALKNTLKLCGLENCVYIADKGFLSEANLCELEQNGMQYIIPLKRDNPLIPYQHTKDLELTDNYFQHHKRFIFYVDTQTQGHRKVNLFVDGKLKEEEKTDYLKRIATLPESFTKEKFKEKVPSMGTLTLIHNTDYTPEQVYREYKNRNEIEQFFDHLKNTLNAAASHMQRTESLNGWMFINHLAMNLIYKLYAELRNKKLNKKQTLNHKYAIADTIEHLKSIKKIRFSNNDSVIAEIPKATRQLLLKLNLSVT